MTFAELEEMEEPTFEVLSSVLKEYAESGAAISSKVVVAVIKKLMLTEAEKNKLTNLARVGVRKQKVLQFPKEAEQYRHVITALA